MLKQICTQNVKLDNMKPETQKELNQFVNENAALFASEEDAKRNKPLYVAVYASKLGVRPRYSD